MKEGSTVEETIFKRIFNSKVRLGMTELSKVTSVSPSQLRYWERKGFIKSHQNKDNQNHYFDIYTMLQVVTIKYFLDQGLTLQAAVDHEKKRHQVSRLFHTFLMKGIRKIELVDKGVIKIDLGPLADDPEQKVEATVTAAGQVKLNLCRQPAKD